MTTLRPRPCESRAVETEYQPKGGPDASVPAATDADRRPSGVCAPEVPAALLTGVPSLWTAET